MENNVNANFLSSDFDMNQINNSNFNFQHENKINNEPKYDNSQLFINHNTSSKNHHLKNSLMIGQYKNLFVDDKSNHKVNNLQMHISRNNKLKKTNSLFSSNYEKIKNDKKFPNSTLAEAKPFLPKTQANYHQYNNSFDKPFYNINDYNPSFKNPDEHNTKKNPLNNYPHNFITEKKKTSFINRNNYPVLTQNHNKSKNQNYYLKKRSDPFSNLSDFVERSEFSLDQYERNKHHGSYSRLSLVYHENQDRNQRVYLTRRRKAELKAEEKVKRKKSGNSSGRKSRITIS
jgi:hypothetical protein